MHPSVRRPDLSEYLVHLTKGTGRSPEEKSHAARENLIRILTVRDEDICRLEGKPEGLFVKAAQKDAQLEYLIRAVSLTETPIEYIEDLISHYSGYGLVFRKEFVKSKRGNPALYLSTSHSDTLRKAAMDLIRVPEYHERTLAYLLPFFTQFGETAQGWVMDYYHEREWRVPQSLEFHHEDVFLGLCENDTDIAKFSADFPEIPFINSKWNMDKKMDALKNWLSPSERRVIYDNCPYGMTGTCPLI